MEATPQREGIGSGASPLAWLAVFGALALGAPAGALSQSPLDDGTYSVSFGFDGRATTDAGVWYAFGRVNMGFLGSVDWARTRQDDGEEVDSSVVASVGPGVKWYFGPAPPVVPFWFGGIDVRVEDRTPPEGPSQRGRGVGIRGGVGADWFPVDGLSIGGWTGLDLSFFSDRETDRSTTRLRTLTTGLSVHLYF